MASSVASALCTLDGSGGAVVLVYLRIGGGGGSLTSPVRISALMSNDPASMYCATLGCGCSVDLVVRSTVTSMRPGAVSDW